MPTVAQAFALASQLHATGRIDEAERTCRQILHAFPYDTAALHLLGLLSHQQGRNQEAAALIGRAVALDGSVTSHHYNHGVMFRLLKRPGDALFAYRRVLRLEPGHVDARANMGRCLADLDRLPEAVSAYRTALALCPDRIDLYQVLGGLLRGRQDRAGAVGAYRAAFRLSPAAGDACNLGIVLKEAEDYAAATAQFQEAAAIAPTFAPAYYGLGDSILRSDAPPQEASRLAVPRLRQAVALDPAYADAWAGLGRDAERTGADSEALRAFGRAVVLRPDDARHHYNHALILERQDRMEEAIAGFDRAIDADPGFEPAYERLGIKLNFCQWDRYDLDVARVLTLVREKNGKTMPIPFTYLPTTPADHLACARAYSREVMAQAQPLRARLAFAFPRVDKPVLTVGYMSGDYREHAVAYLVAGLFEEHDRRRFRVVAYSSGPDSNQPMRQRLEAAFDAFTTVRDMTAEEAARRIHADGVDILVDLSGHTRYCRTDVMALAPAPVRVNYLGYPGTMGADTADYIVVDPFVAPLEHQPYYTERLVQMPHAYQVNDRHKTAAPPRSRADYGLPEDAFVFCCFNNSSKISPVMFDVWMRLLHAVPDSVLWLLIFDPRIAGHLRRHAAARGVDPARLVFAPMMPQTEHLARYAAADLFLDTAPYTAHTTGSDSLWMGCPLVTLAGDTFPSRVAGSLLRSFGMDDLVTYSLADYEALALALALDRPRLAGIRARLAANRAGSPLYDTPRFARGLEWAYERMWQRFLDGSAPNAIVVPADLP